MNQNIEIQKIKVNNGQELVAKAREYKNSGGEWKLRERYTEMPIGGIGKRKNRLGWGIVVSNSEQTIDIFSPQHNVDYKDLVEKDLVLLDEVNARPELWQLFPEAKFALFDSGNEKINTSTRKELKKDNEEGYALYRYLVAENFDDLKKIIENYFRENEAKIYNSANRKFSDWAEIVDGQDGNMYLYVGEKNENSGREIKIGIKKSNWKEREKGDYESCLTSKKMLESQWGLLLLTTTQPLTPTEKENAYRGLEETFKEQWPIRERLCRGYWESMAEKMGEAIDYLDRKEFSNSYELAIALAKDRAEIKKELNKNQNIKICSDTCEHGLSKNKPSTPTLPKKGNSGKNKNNQISDPQKTQLLQYFLEHNISKISLENGKLTIEYKSGEVKKEVNDAEIEQYKNLIENSPNHSLTLTDLQKTKQNSSNPTKNPQDNKLVIGLALGVGAVALVGVVVYLWNRKNDNQRSKKRV